MILKTVFPAIALAFAFAMPTEASTTINVATDGSWNEFDVDELTSASGGLEWIDNITGTAGYTGDGSPLSFQFTLATPGTLTVVDGGFVGDEFSVTINGTDYDTSSPAHSDFPNVGTDFDAALATGDLGFSRLILDLEPGSYIVTGLLTVSALDFPDGFNGVAINATVGGLKVTASPVPVPAAIWLFGSAMAGLMGVRRRKSTVAA